MPFPLMIHTSGNQVYLHVYDPNNSQVNYKSDKFYRKNAKQKYETDQTFKQWFDYAVDLSIYYRITQGVFQASESGALSEESNEVDESIESAIPDNVDIDNYGHTFDTNTGEVVDD